MRIESIRRGRATTTVTVTGFAADRPVSDDMIVGFAMASARENPSSLFGWTCDYNGGEFAVVRLHTD